MSRYKGWDNDVTLEEDLRKYVSQNLKREEILSFVTRDYSQYPWSLRSLDRRLRYFNIRYIDRNVDLEQVRTAVQEELDGPGKLLGYRPMHQKVRQVHHLNVPRHLVHTIMYDLDPDGLKGRVLGKNTRAKGHFTTKGPNFVHSLDGHAKLMGYQRDTFPLAMYGCIDTASRKLLWLKIWTSHSDPRLIGRWYFDRVYETKTLPSKIRIGKGTETGKLATMHAFLRRHQEDGIDPLNTVIYGPSTSNQIERWWRELHERLEKYYKEHLKYLLDRGFYDPHNELDRSLLAYLFVPLLQKELNVFKDSVWNTHRIRHQKETYLPDGVPNHVYEFPEEYGLEECGLKVTVELLKEASIQSGILDEVDYLDENCRRQCEQLIPEPDEVKPKDCKDAYLYLKDKYQEQQQ